MISMPSVIEQDVTYTSPLHKGHASKSSKRSFIKVRQAVSLSLRLHTIMRSSPNDERLTACRTETERQPQQRLSGDYASATHTGAPYERQFRAPGNKAPS